MSFGATNPEVADLAFLICMEMEIQERHVCRGLIDIHIVSDGYTLIKILRLRDTMKLPDCGCP